MRKSILALMTALVSGVTFANALTDAALSSVRVTAPQVVKAAAKGGRMLMAAAPDSGCKVTLAFTGEKDEVFPLPVTRGSNFEFDFFGDQSIVPVYYIVKEANPPTETQYVAPLLGHYVVTITSDTRIEVVCRRPIYVDGDLLHPHVKDASTGYYPGNALRTIQEGVDLALDGAEVRVRGGRSYAPFTATNRVLRITTFIPVDPSAVDWEHPAVIDGGGTNRCVTVVDMWTNVLKQASENDPAYKVVVDPLTNGQFSVEGFVLTNGYTKANGGGAWGGTFVACRIAGCRADGYGGGLFDAEARNCLVTGCSAGIDGVGAAESVLKNCTVAGNNVTGKQTAVSKGTVSCNTVVSGNGYGLQIGEGCLSIATFTTGVLFDETWHLRPNSAGIKGGLQEFVEDEYDLEGKPRRDGVNVTAGCFQNLAQSVLTPVGVTVDGTDLMYCGGNGWEYDPNTSNLTFTAIGSYVLAGAGTGVTVRVDANVSLFFNNLRLDGVKGPVLTVANGKTLTVAGGTADLNGSGDIPGKVVVAGGNLCLNGKTFADAVDVVDQKARHVEIDLKSDGEVKISGLDGYETKGMRTIGGKLHLWLSDGSGSFGIVDAGHPGGATCLYIVNEFLTYGEIFNKAPSADVGIKVDGTDVRALAGEGWSYFPTSSNLFIVASGEYELSGQAQGPRVTVAANADVTFKDFKTETDGSAISVVDGVKLTVRGGTGDLRGTDDVQGRVLIDGGNFSLNGQGVNPAPSNTAGRAVFCVTAGGLESLGGLVRLEGLEGYGVDGIRLIDGKLCLWLPEGNGGFLIFDADNAEKFLFCEYSIRNGVVDVSVRPPAATGVTVNGTDVGLVPGAGWVYHPKGFVGGDGIVELTGAGPYVLSGTNTAGEVMFSVAASTAVTLSNLCLKCTTEGGSCLRTTNDATVELYLAGTNTLDASGADDKPMGEGLCVGNGTRLTVFAAPGFADEDAVLIANGSRERAAIAVGRNGPSGAKPYFAITGGTVLANWGAKPAWYSTGIGVSKTNGVAGTNGEADIVISGGRVLAKGGRYSPGIGSAEGVESGAPSIRITGGFVEAVGSDNAAAIGGAPASRFKNVVVEGGTVSAAGGYAGTDIGLGQGGYESGGVTLIGGSVLFKNNGHYLSPYPTNSVGQRVYCVTVGGLEGSGGLVSLEGLEGYGTKDIYPIDGKVYLWLPNGEYLFRVDGALYQARVANGPATAHGETPVDYLGWDGSKAVPSVTNALTLGADVVTLENGLWYVVEGDVATADLKVNGTAHLILADGATLTATGSDKHAGITVEKGNSLTIYGQVKGSGELIAQGGSRAAGIGGGEGVAGGAVTVNGGRVRTAGTAGIDGCDGGSRGTVTVNGGTVTSVGSEKLPAGYTPVEYIESTKGGGQYINTGVAAKTGVKVEARALWTTESQDSAFIGARKDDNKTRFYPIWYFNGALSYGHREWYSISGAEVPANSVVDIVSDFTTAGQATIRVGDREYKITDLGDAFDTGLAMYLGALNYGGNARSGMQGRIYSCKIYEMQSGALVLVRDFVPCVKTETGKAGLWDFVEGKFYGSAGDNAFLVGPPQGYAAVEYIESTTDGGQYINTGYTPQKGTKVVCRLLDKGTDTSKSYGTIFGSRKGWSRTMGMYLWLRRDGNTQPCYGRAGAQGNKDKATFPYGDVTTVTCEGRKCNWVNDAGSRNDGIELSADYVEEQEDGITPLLIFALNSSDVVNGCNPTDSWGFRLYSFTIYENDVLKRDFVPCVSPTAGAGLWDRVGGSFYPNKGGSAFVAGGRVGGLDNVMTINGGSVKADKINTQPVNAGGQLVYCVTVGDLGGSEGPVFLEGLGSYGVHHVYPDEDGKVYLWLPNGDYTFRVNGIPQRANVVSGPVTAGVVPGAQTVNYLDWNGSSLVQKTVWALPLTDVLTVIGRDNWYVVNGEVTTRNLRVDGTAHLILADGARLTANGEADRAGIGVGPGNSFFIYGQAHGTGELAANGGVHSAGIGGGNKQGGGAVTINGGVIRARSSGSAGSGIGGGDEGGFGSLTVNGGRITAEGAPWGSDGDTYAGAGIGTGSVAWGGGTVTINGGTVTAVSGGSSADDIGRGGHPSGGGVRVVITGGSVLRRNNRGPRPVDAAGTQLFCVTVEGVSDTDAIELPTGYGAQDVHPIDGKLYLWFPNGSNVFKVGEKTYTAIVKDGAVTIKSGLWLAVDYIEWSGSTATRKSVQAMWLDGVSVGNGEWYCTTGSVSLASLTVSGTANLILADGAKLTVTGDVTGGTLNVFGQDAGTGDLTVSGTVGASLNVQDCRIAANAISGSAKIIGGTVSQVKPGATLTVDGGSVFAESGVTAKNSAGVVVYPVVVELPADLAFASSTLDFMNLEGYWTHGIRPLNGKVCLWLPNGRGKFRVKRSDMQGNDAVYEYTVNNAAGTVRSLVLTETGVTVNGTDAGEWYGAGWEYDQNPGDVGGTVRLTGTGPYVLSGTNTAGAVMMVLVDASAKVTLSNLCLKCTTEGGSCLRVANNATVALSLAGMNTLDASGANANTSMGTGLCIENGARLTVSAASGFADENAVLIANGGYNRAAIAVGRSVAGEPRATFEIVGGVVFANRMVDIPANGSAGIGGEADILISGGYVEAVGGMNAAAIGGGDGGRHGKVVVSGGTVSATGGDNATDISKGRDDKGGDGFTVTGGNVFLTRGQADPAPTNGDGKPVYCVTVGGLEGLVRLEGLEGYGTKDIVPIGGRVYLWLPNGTYAFKANGVHYKATVSSGPATAVNVQPGDVEVEYLDWTGSETQLKTTKAFVLTNATTVIGDDNWYVVKGEVTTTNLRVDGTAHLILADGAKLTANGEADRAGIGVGPGNSFFIYGQTHGTGELAATGGNHSAGIGGGNKQGGGAVTINGGVIRARSSGHAGSGIGGGDEGGFGSLTVNGGRITAEGASWGSDGDTYAGAGIGTGSVAWGGGTVTINGGTVTAVSGGSSADDIGRGGHPSGGGVRVVITGGSVLRRNNRGPRPVDASGAQLFCVTLEGLSDAELIELPLDYGLQDVHPIDGKLYLWLPNGEHVIMIDGRPYVVTVDGRDATTQPMPAATVGYMDWNGSGLVQKSAQAFVLPATAKTIGWDNWYVVWDEMETTDLKVNGTAHLILADGAKLTATGGAYHPGLGVTEGNVLKIYGQSLGTGELVANGTTGSAGIGGSEGVSGGTVTINGGVVTANGGDKLPEGYTAVTYIESTKCVELTKSGGQYINTGYVPNLNTRIVADFNPLTKGDNWLAFFGVTGNDSSSDGVLLRYYNDKSINGWFCNGAYTEARIGNLANSRITAELKKGGMTLNGQTAAITTTGMPYYGPIYLFCVNNGGSAWRHQAMRLYFFKIYEGDTLVRDFVPCVTATGEAGLFDSVEGKFYSNAGEWQQFNAGAKTSHVGAGIGGGAGASGGVVTINGGVVMPTGGAGIGGGAGGSGGVLRVNGGTVKKTRDFTGSAPSDPIIVSKLNFEANRTLMDGMTYRLMESFDYTAADGQSAMKVENGARVVLEIPGGLTVTLRGGKAVGRNGAGAGIEVPPDAELSIIGGGKLEAFGGNAADGCKGGNAPLGWVRPNEDGSGDDKHGQNPGDVPLYLNNGGGGRGGDGGGGAGAGIGGRGATGGVGGAGALSQTGYWSGDVFSTPGNWGGAGGRGGFSIAAGRISIAPTVKVDARPGAAGGSGGACGESARMRFAWLVNHFGAWGGGSGGGGGAGGAALAGIGAGGVGGGGGGGGGAGSLEWFHEVERFLSHDLYGAGGLGGLGATAAGNGHSGTNSLGEVITIDGKTAPTGSGKNPGSSWAPRGGPGVGGAAGVVSLPDGYAAVEYIASTAGGGQYIDTGYTHKTNTSISCEVAVAENGHPYTCAAVFGSRPGGWTEDTHGSLVFFSRFWGLLPTLEYQVGCDSGETKGAEYSFPYEKRVGIFADVAARSVSWFGGNQTGLLVSNQNTLSDGKSPLFVFDFNCGENGASNPSGQRCVMKLYSLSIYEGGKLERDFVPCVKTVTGEAGLWDLAHGKFYGNGGVEPFGVGGVAGNLDGVVTINGGSVKTDNLSAQLTNAAKQAVYCVTVEGLEGSEGLVRLEGLEGYGTQDIYPDENGKVYLWLPNGEYVFKVNGELHQATVANGPATAYAAIPVEYLDWNGSEMVPSVTNALALRSDISTLGGGNWYVVTGEVATTDLKVNGTAHLILADGAKLTAKGGIRLSEGNELTIYGQAEGSGSLVTVSVPEDCAGIGGARYVASGTLTINGGQITATGGADGSGLGGGDHADNGVVTINGGVVTATGGTHGAGIGGAGDVPPGSIGTVTINGGTVRVTGGVEANDIGSYQGKGKPGLLTITGGSVYCVNGTDVQPKNAANQAVYCVTVEGLGSLEGLGGSVRLVGLEGYGDTDIYPIDGKIYIYLPNGEGVFSVTGEGGSADFCYAVNGGPTTAKPYAIRLVGLYVNGVDALYGPREGWTFGPASRILTLDGNIPDYSLVGSNTEVKVFAAGTSSITLYSSAVGAVDIATNANARLAFSGPGCAIAGDLRLLDQKGSLEITDGTVEIKGSVQGGPKAHLRISGGSVDIRGDLFVRPTDVNGFDLLRTVVVVPDGCPADVPVKVEGLGSYGVSELYPRNGRLHFWLPDQIGLESRSFFTVNGDYFRLDGDRDESVEIRGVRTGFVINGSDCATAPKQGWVYDIYNGVLSLDGSVPYRLFCTNVVSGYSVVPTATGTTARISGTVDWRAEGRAFDGPFVIEGGNILAATRQFSVAPKNAAGRSVHAVRLTLPDDVDPSVKIELGGLSGYSTEGMFAVGREVCLWLPDGEHEFTVNGARCHAVVDGDDTWAAYCATGVRVDGVEIATECGLGWTWSPVTKNLRIEGRHRLDTDTNGFERVSLVCGADAAITGGTSDFPAEDVKGGLLITGGSHLFTGTFAVPPSNGVDRVWRVEAKVPYGVADGDEVAVSCPGYSGTGVRARDGKVYFWLPNGTGQIFTIDGTLYKVDVCDSNAVASMWETGLTVNGDDIGGGRGPGWRWTYADGQLVLTDEVDAYVYSGEPEFNRALTTVSNSTTIVMNGAILAAGKDHAAFTAASNVVATLRFAGPRNQIVGTKYGDEQVAGLALAGEGGFVIAGGTAEVGQTDESPSIAAPVEINGGSIRIESQASFAIPPVNAASQRVYRVTVPMPRFADRGRALPVEGLPDYYDVSEIYPYEGEALDETGSVYLWLPTNSYDFTVGGYAFHADVTGEDWTEAKPKALRTGVFVNGVDCWYGNDMGWTWSRADGTLYLSGERDYVIKGTNADGWVSIAVTNVGQATTVILDDLALSGFTNGCSAIDIRPGAELLLGLIGDSDSDGSVLEGASGSYHTDLAGGAGIHVPAGAKLTVGESLIVKADPDAYETLTVVGGRLAAGIGGNAGEAMGEVTVSDHMIVVVGGDRGAGIGGGSRGAGGIVHVTGGDLVALGGDGIDGSGAVDDLGGAGIGGGWNGAGGAVTVEGGIVTALGGTGGAVIGGGAGGDGGTLTISSGTVYPYEMKSSLSGASVFGGGSGGADGVNVFRGGSICVTNGQIRAAASNGSERVTLVPIRLPRTPETDPDYKALFVRVQIDGLPPDYGTRDIFTYEGTVYLWLPDGTYDFTMDGYAYHVTVNDGTVTESHYRATGVRVNGRDVCFAEGPGWSWTPATGTLSLSSEIDYVVTGEAELSNVWAEASGAARVSLSNFTAAASIEVPLQVAANAQASFRFIGESDRFAAIGGSGTAVVAGGNVVFGRIPDGANVEVKGGNVFVEGAFPTNRVTDGQRPVVPVTITLPESCVAETPVTFAGLPADYDTKGVRAIGGKVCVWLPYGTYEIDVTGSGADGATHTWAKEVRVFDFGYDVRDLELITVTDDSGFVLAVIPRAWVRKFGLVAADASTDDYMKAVRETSKNAGIPVWQSYVAGLDPTDPSQTFYAVIEMLPNGAASVGPNKMRENRVYQVVGSPDLEFTNVVIKAVGSDGRAVFGEFGTNGFFRVKVGLE